MLSIGEVKSLAAKYGVNTQVVSLSTLRNAILIELEHRALIGQDHEKALIIALAHLREDPHYYKRLVRMESQANKYWKTHDKPNVFL